MVADAHDGYVASHEAVKRFPSLFTKKYAREHSSDRNVMQAYVDAFLELYVLLLNIGKKSGVIYERVGYSPREDFSSTTLHTIVSLSGNYYALGAGDSSTAIIRGNNLILVKPVCPYFIGFIDLRYKIKEEVFDYDKKCREIGDSFDARRKVLRTDEITGEVGKELFEEEERALERLSAEFSTAPLPSMDYTHSYVQKVIPVRRLDVLPGDLLFQCTDGLRLDSSSLSKNNPVSYLINLFKDPTIPIHDALSTLFTAIQKREISIEFDNVAACARRIL